MARSALTSCSTPAVGAPVSGAGSEAGVVLDERDEHCGFTGYTCFYRVLDPTVMPRMMRGNANVLVMDGFGGFSFLADNGTVAVVVAWLPQDSALQGLIEAPAWSPIRASVS